MTNEIGNVVTLKPIWERHLRSWDEAAAYRAGVTAFRRGHLTLGDSYFLRTVGPEWRRGFALAIWCENVMTRQQHLGITFRSQLAEIRAE